MASSDSFVFVLEFHSPFVCLCLTVDTNARTVNNKDSHAKDAFRKVMTSVRFKCIAN